jgi:hypothetical protein
MTKNKKKPRKYQKPVSLYPLKIEKALEVFMKIKGKKRQDK